MKIYFSHANLAIFLENLGAVRNTENVIIKIYEGWLNLHMIKDCCWMLHLINTKAVHTKKKCNRSSFTDKRNQNCQFFSLSKDERNQGCVFVK